MEHKNFKLSNGLSVKYCVMPNTYSISIVLALKGGTSWENSSQKGITHLAIHNELATPQEYLDTNENVSYLDVQKAAREIFKPENMVFLIHDAPNEQELLNVLYKNKEILRKELGA